MTSPIQDYCLIPLTQGQFAKVSPHRFEELNQWKWSAFWCKDGQRFYAYRKASSTEDASHPSVFMHRYILGLERGDKRQCDHRDRDSLNNTDDNLRIATQTQQNRNQGIRRNNTSGFKGVCFKQDVNKWVVTIRISGKRLFVGHFPPNEQGRIAAAHAYDAAAIQHHGEFAHFNFPTRPPQP